MTITLTSPGGAQGKGGVGEDGTGVFPLPVHHVEYKRGLSSDETFRIALQSDEVFELYRLSLSRRGSAVVPSGVTFLVKDINKGDVLAKVGGKEPVIKTGSGDDPISSSSAGSEVIGQITVETVQNVEVNAQGLGRITKNQ